MRLALTEMLATRFVAPHLARFRQRYPNIELDLYCTNHIVSLSRRDADIAVRLSRPREQGLVIKRLSSIELGLYASQEYLATHDAPAGPEKSLDGHSLLLFRDSRHFDRENRWLRKRAHGAHVVLRSDSVSAVFSAIVGGS